MSETNSFRYRQLQSCKCFKMRKASRFVTQFYDKKLKTSGIKITQFTILSFLATGEKKNLNVLSDELMMDRTTLTRGLDILMKEKLIEEVKDEDARKRVVKLTNKGLSTLDVAIPLWLEAEEEIMNECKRHNFSVI